MVIVLIKYWVKFKLAQFLRYRYAKQIVPGKIGQLEANRWNAVQCVLVTRGVAKFNWDKIFMRVVYRCKRCLDKVEKGDNWCNGCKKLIEKSNRKSTSKK